MTTLLDVPPGGGLYLAAFEGVAETEAEKRRADAEAVRPEVIWMPVGVQGLADPAKAAPLPASLAAGMRETTFRPLTGRRRRSGGGG